MTMRRLTVISVTAVVSLMAASPAPAATEARVEISDHGFTPDPIEVAVGDVVEWWNTDEVAHTVTAENGSFDSGPLEPGAAFSLTFEAAGTYTYSSSAEGDEIWNGTVVVREAPEPEDTPTEDPPDESVIDPDASPPPDEDPEQPPPTLEPETVSSEKAVPAPLVARSTVSVAQSGPTVTIVDNAYQPREVEVSPGTTVVWEQVGELPHTVTADDGSFDSGEMGQGDTYSRDFPQSGTFPYYCRFHGGSGGAGMAGVVVVSGDDGGPSDSGGDGGTNGAPSDGGTGSSLAETGAGPVGPLAGAIAALLGIGSGCLLLDRRRRVVAVRLTALERARLVPGGMSLG
jgi:plastocyanin